MQPNEWSNIEKKQLNPKFARQVVHGETLTVARVYLEKGCVVPEHSHHNEQISIVEQGVLVFHVSGKDHVVRAGEVFSIPVNAPHCVEALEDSVAIDVFAPVREDWRSGDDAYLRK